MTRDEKINFIIEAVEHIEGVKVHPKYYKEHTDEQLDKAIELYDYLLNK